MLDATGWGILLVLLLVTAGLWIPALARLVEVGPGLSGFLGFLLGGLVQSGRPDRSFLNKTAFPAWKVGLTDLFLALLPGALLLFIMGNWPAALCFWGAGLVAAIIPAGQLSGISRRKARFSIPLIPPDLFEWHTAIRRYPLGWLLVALLQLGAGFHIAFFLSAVAIGLMLLGAVFEFAEPKELLPGDRRALLRKWRRYALALHLFFLPAYGLGAIGQWEHIWLVLYAVLALETMLALVFFYKYSVWQPGLERLSGSVFTAIGLVLVLLPGGILAALPMAVWTAVKAVRRMQYWWNEYPSPSDGFSPSDG